MEEDLKRTEGGFLYLEKDGLKIRENIVNRRLTEDGETFEEYRERLKYVKAFDKDKKKGKLFWSSARGTYVEAELREYIANLEAQNG